MDAFVGLGWQGQLVLGINCRLSALTGLQAAMGTPVPQHAGES